MITISKTASATADNTVIYTSHNIDQFNWHELEIVTAPTDGAIDVWVSHDGTNYAGVALYVKQRSDDTLTNAPSAAGLYYFLGQFKLMKIQNAGAAISQAPAIRITHSKV